MDASAGTPIGRQDEDQSEQLGRSQKSSDSSKKILGIEDKPEHWIHTMQAETFFGFWIVLNAVILAVETDHQHPGNEDVWTASGSHKHPGNENDWGWILMDSIFNVVFLVEVILRVVAEKAQWPCVAWNLIDAFLVVIGIIDAWILRAIGSDSGAAGVLVVLRIFRLLRLLRVLRVIRLMKSSKELLLLIAGIGAGLKAMIWGAMLLIVINFISGLIMTQIVGKDMFDGAFALNGSEECGDGGDTPCSEFYTEQFGKLYLSMFTLFEFTMEFQGGYCKATWPDGPWLSFFFIAYTFVTNLALLQVIGSVIVEAILAIAEKNRLAEKADAKEVELQVGKKTTESLYDTLEKTGNRSNDGKLIYKDMNFSDPKMAKALAMVGVAPSQAMKLVEAMDRDHCGALSRTDFVQGIMRVKQEVNPKDVFHIECRLASLKRKIFASFEKQERMLTVMARARGKA